MESNAKNDDPISLMFQGFLGESPSQSRILANDWRKFEIAPNTLWEKFKSSSLESSLEQTGRMAVNDEDSVKTFLQGTRGGVVLLTIHMGDFLHGILKLSGLSHRRNVLVMRRREPSKEELKMFNKMASFGHRITVISHDSSSLKSAIKMLRRGAIFVLLHDLSREWGKTIPVKAFGHTLQWVSGPIEIAILGKSCVLPFYCFRDAGIHHCQVEPIRDYRAISYVPREQFVRKEVQNLVSLSERYIRRYPSQWSHWPLIPKMLQG